MTPGVPLTVEALVERHRAILAELGELTPAGWRAVAERARRTLAGRTGTRRRDSIPATSLALVEQLIAECETQAKALEG